MVLPQAMAWMQYWFRVLSLKFCGKSKKICGDISPVSPAFSMYVPGLQKFSNNLFQEKISATSFKDLGCSPQTALSRNVSCCKTYFADQAPPTLLSNGQQAAWKMWTWYFSLQQLVAVGGGRLPEIRKGDGDNFLPAIPGISTSSRRVRPLQHLQIIALSICSPVISFVRISAQSCWLL